MTNNPAPSRMGGAARAKHGTFWPAKSVSARPFAHRGRLFAVHGAPRRYGCTAQHRNLPPRPAMTYIG